MLEYFQETFQNLLNQNYRNFHCYKKIKYILIHNYSVNYNYHNLNYFYLTTI